VTETVFVKIMSTEKIPKENEGLLGSTQNSNNIHIIKSSTTKDSEGLNSPPPGGGPLRFEMEPSSNDASCKKAKNYVAKTARTICTLQAFLSWFPIVQWVPNYNLQSLGCDVIAGLTLALTVIPQGIGYAPLAGLPLQYGLYGSIVPGFVYAIFGTIKETTVGPTAINALMSYNYAGSSPIRSLTLSFFVGLIEIAAGVLNLGRLLGFISAPVISAFTSAVSIQVATSQVKGLLGLKVPGRGFLNTWIGVFSNISAIRPCDAAMGFACIGILLFLRKLKDLRWLEGTDPESKRAKILRKSKWAISIARNSMVVLVSSIIAYAVTEVWGKKDALILTGDVEEGLPSWQLPWKFNVHKEKHLYVNMSSGNTSSDNPITENPLDMAEDFGIGLAMVALVSILQHLAIAKFYTAPSQKMDASQEITALGLCNFIGSFIGSMPVTASFGRSAINSSSGVRTPFGGCITGLIILAACAFLTPHFAYIPTAALSAVIICAMIFTIEVEVLLPIWRSKKIDMIPFTLTFLIGLFVSPEMGMIVGSCSHLCILIYTSGTPKVSISKRKADDVPYVLVRPDRALLFPSVETIRTKLTSSVAGSSIDNNKKVDNDADIEANNVSEENAIIIDFSYVCDMDYTAAKGIRALSKVMKKSGKTFYFCCMKENIESVLQGADSTPFVTYSTIQDAEQKLRTSC